MKNSIGGTIKQVSWDQLIEMADKGVRTRMCDMAAREDVAGMLACRVEALDSPRVGQITFMIYGPGCTLKTVPEGPIGDVPSRFAYPFAYWSKE